MQVQHAYQCRQLDLDPTVLIGLGAVNCKLEASFPYSMLIIVLLIFSLQTLRILYCLSWQTFDGSNSLYSLSSPNVIHFFFLVNQYVDWFSPFFSQFLVLSDSILVLKL